MFKLNKFIRIRIKVEMRFTFLCINIIFYISMVLLWQEVQLAFYLFELNQYFQLLQLYIFFKNTSICTST